MPDKPIINIVGQDMENPAMEEQYNKWYRDTHRPIVARTKGLKSVIRYKRIGDDKTLPHYIAIYNFDSLKAFEEYNASRGTAAGGGTAAGAGQVASRPEGIVARMRAQYELIEGWEK